MVILSVLGNLIICKTGPAPGWQEVECTQQIPSVLTKTMETGGRKETAGNRLATREGPSQGEERNCEDARCLLGNDGD